MTTIHPELYINEIARRMPELTGRDEIEEALDRLEYMFEVISPEMQDNFETLIGMLREKHQGCSISFQGRNRGADTGCFNDSWPHQT